MSKHRVVVLKIVAGQLSVSQAAQQYQMSRQYLHRLLARYRAEGLAGLEPRSRRPRSNPATTSEPVRARVVELRLALTASGLDAGPATISWHLEQEGFRPPALSTIRRILHSAGLVTAQPRKRPKTSYVRFQAELPNQCWQSDFTHWQLADGTGVEILNWLDDHSRYLLACVAFDRVTGDDVVNTFLTCCDTHGTPASTLTDNGAVYTSRFTGGRNAFEYLLPLLGVIQKNGSPNHPQTQGKIERFHQTLKRWLAAQPPAATLAVLQHQLDTFTGHYNHHRPHRALDRATPAAAYHANPKALPANTTTSTSHYRIRYDRIDKTGRITLRRAGRLHHLHIAATHRGTRVLALIDDTTVTTIALDTGEILATHTINPNRNYWPNTQKEPGRWPSSS